MQLLYKVRDIGVVVKIGHIHIVVGEVLIIAVRRVGLRGVIGSILAGRDCDFLTLQAILDIVDGGIVLGDVLYFVL